MKVYRNRSGSVGRPFTKGNPGGGRPKRAQNKPPWRSRSSPGTFLCRTGTGGPLSGASWRARAPQMEVLLHHYAFGKPTNKYTEPAPPAPPEAELMSRMTKEERRQMYDLATKMREIRQAAAARSAAPPATAPRSAAPRASGPCFDELSPSLPRSTGVPLQHWGGTTDVRVPRDHDSPARRVPDGNR